MSSIDTHEAPHALNKASFAEIIGGLTDHMEMLIKAHMALLRKEVKEDAAELGRDVALLIVCLVVGLIGYIFLNATIVVCVAVFASATAGALTAVGLTLIHLIAAGAALYKAYTSLRHHRFGPQRTETELKEDGQWLKQLTAS